MADHYNDVIGEISKVTFVPANTSKDSFDYKILNRQFALSLSANHVLLDTSTSRAEFNKHFNTMCAFTKACGIGGMTGVNEQDTPLIQASFSVGNTKDEALKNRMTRIILMCKACDIDRYQILTFYAKCRTITQVSVIELEIENHPKEMRVMLLALGMMEGCHKCGLLELKKLDDGKAEHRDCKENEAKESYDFMKWLSKGAKR